jgi:hypothetical protein
LTYLKNLPDFDISVEAADATDKAAMNEVVKRIVMERPLGGCILMTLQLEDGLFINLTDREFNEVVKNKVESWHTLEAVCNIGSLDFVVGFSSAAALAGSPGQSNYTT